jgi:[ribosomal protein S18]-alanine N-acetyltransferase
MIQLEPVRRDAVEVLATPLSQLHAACFPDDPWSPQAVAEIIAMIGVFGRIAYDDTAATITRDKERCFGSHSGPCRFESLRPGDTSGQLTGLVLAQSFSAECEILTLGVVPGRRRAGVGSALLASVVEEARCRGARTLFLEVAEDNVAARALYAAHGFVQIRRRANYYRRLTGLVDALVLHLLLVT